MAILRWRPIGQSVERWDPFREVGDFQSELNRVFDGFFGRTGTMPGGDRVWAPAVDMYETKDDLVVTAELPGVNEKEVQLSITGDVLSLRGERTLNQDTSQENFHRGERWYGRFERHLSLPISVQADKVKATYRDGVLTITLPKAEEIKPKSIKIDVL
jgi:HSP20 family protein